MSAFATTWQQMHGSFGHDERFKPDQHVKPFQLLSHMGCIVASQERA